MDVYSREVAAMIAEGNKQWEKHVPRYVANSIKEKGLFGYGNDA